MAKTAVLRLNCPMRLAIISDIHGNGIALDAVLADIHQQGADRIICLGDIANAGPHPSYCLDTVREVADVVIQGNHELYLLGDSMPDDIDTSPIWAGLRWVRRQLRPDQFDYMRRLPYSYCRVQNGGTPTLFTHGSPASQFLGFKAEYGHEAIVKRMNGHDGLTLFVGHTHRQLYHNWARSWICNVGSVGMPLDGTPEAKYVLATWQPPGWQIEFRRVAYDWGKLTAAFDEAGYQQAGGVITALFRYQMLYGRDVLWHYLTELRQQAELIGVTEAELYPRYPVPAVVQQWVR